MERREFLQLVLAGSAVVAMPSLPKAKLPVFTVSSMIKSDTMMNVRVFKHVLSKEDIQALSDERQVSDWEHIVVSSNGNRVKMYVNMEEVSDWQMQKEREMIVRLLEEQGVLSEIRQAIV
jgi:hypothetical protein